MERVYTAPLLDKLGIRPGMRVAIVGDLDADLEAPVIRAAIEERTSDVTNGLPAPDTDVVLLLVDTTDELAVLSELPEALIVRTSFLFGPGRSTFVDRAIERARQGEKVRAVLDWVNNPTYTVDLARILVDLIAADAKGIVHASNAGSCSKFEFARAACRIAAVDDPPIEPIRLSDLPLPAKRPQRTPFDLTKLGGILEEPPRSWEEALEAYLLGEDDADDVDDGDDVDDPDDGDDAE